MFKQYNFENNVTGKCSLKAVTLFLLLSFFLSSNEAVETHVPRHRRPKSHDIEIQSPKNPDIETRRQLTHDIVIPRHFFRGQKATTSRSRGILTLMPPNIICNYFKLKNDSSYYNV